MAWRHSGTAACTAGDCQASVSAEKAVIAQQRLLVPSRAFADIAVLACRGDHVLRFPVIHRQRIFAVKKELLQMHGESIISAHLLAQLSACRVRQCLASL